MLRIHPKATFGPFVRNWRGRHHRPRAKVAIFGSALLPPSSSSTRKSPRISLALFEGKAPNRSIERQWRANFWRAHKWISQAARQPIITAANRGCFSSECPLPVITSHVDFTPPNKAVCSHPSFDMSYDNGWNMQILILDEVAIVRPRRKHQHSIRLHVVTV